VVYLMLNKNLLGIGVLKSNAKSDIHHVVWQENHKSAKHHSYCINKMRK